MIIEKIKIYKNMQGLYNMFGNTPSANLKETIPTVAFKLRQESVRPRHALVSYS